MTSTWYSALTGRFLRILVTRPCQCIGLLGCGVESEQDSAKPETTASCASDAAISSKSVASVPETYCACRKNMQRHLNKAYRTCLL